MVRNPLQAMTRRPSEFLRSSWPWRSALYLLSGGVIGGATALVAAALAAAGVLLTVALLGLVILAAMAFSGVLVGGFERWRLRLVDLDPIETPHRRPAEPGYRSWLATRFREPATWRELAFTAMSLLVLCWVDLGVIGLAVYVPVQVAILGAYDDVNGGLLLLVSVPFGLGLAVCSMYVLAAWAGARAALTRAVLAPRDDELGDRLIAVTASRARLVDLFELERSRIERDLHDGAQQRLTALIMRLGLLKLDVDGPAREGVDEALTQARAALDDVRELIRGIHPKVLSDRGLAAAVRDIAGRGPVPVDVDLDLPRLPAPLELTAYFIVSEALANVGKHSGATHAGVRGRVEDGRLWMEIRDDGHGGADPARGTGLTGLADRTAVHDGTLMIASPLGGPTVLRVELPCE
ncbi:histidine kinase [Actinorhabdospora filicis]|uniref:histidine kinase n=1 Tax=Actinorhabdospora filicis TaxID=1785913 RepID=A0A9W6WAJ5_9ACTN|nr:sensor domain-containing protein [Actinorhabdospora filicis]GLZ77705.1 histidine kinase [Actinorhabdospora filicis]